MDKVESRNLRSFGIILGGILLVFGIRLFFKSDSRNWIYLVIAGSAFGIMGLIFPAVLKPIYKIWMRITYIIGWLNGKILFTLVFYIIFVPIGVFIKLIGKDMLGLRMDKGKASYWIKRKPMPTSPRQYEKQF